MKRRKGAKTQGRSVTLWGGDSALDEMMLDYTVGNDRETDKHLLPWDVLGSLGHVEGLRASGLITGADHRKLRAGLRAAFRAVQSGRLAIGPEHEDAHSAVELWLTRRVGAAGQRLHTGRSRNDQVATDIRLYLKDSLLALQVSTLATVAALLLFAERNRDALWPGYTHTRRAMPSSAGLWAAAFAEGLLDTVEALPSLWARVDRSPLGSAARAMACRCRSIAKPLRRRSASPASITTSPRCRMGAGSSRPTRCSGACSSATSSPGSPPT